MAASAQWRRGALVGAALLLVGLVASPALARPIEQEHFSFTGEFEDFPCAGLDAFVDAHLSTLLNTRGPDGIAYWSGNFHGINVWTNRVTHKSVTIRFNVADRDLQITDNGDGTLLITWQGTGSEQIFGPDGRLLSVRAGLQRGQLVVDHGGTPADLSDDELLEDLGLVMGPTGRYDQPDVDDTTSCDQLLHYTS